MTQETVAPADAAQISREIQELLQMMRSPQGLRSAILMREIFDRPEHRW
jgi:tellurite resistance protein